MKSDPTDKSMSRSLDALLARLAAAESQCASLRENYNSFSNRFDDVNADLQSVRSDVKSLQRLAKQQAAASAGGTMPTSSTATQPTSRPLPQQQPQPQRSRQPIVQPPLQFDSDPDLFGKPAPAPPPPQSAPKFRAAPQAAPPPPPAFSQSPVDLGYASYDSAPPPKNRQGPSANDSFNPNFSRSSAPQPQPAFSQSPVDHGYASYDSAPPPKNRQGPSANDAFNPNFSRSSAPPPPGPTGNSGPMRGGATQAGGVQQPYRAGFDEGPGIRNTGVYVPRAPSGARR
jgi:hypothetical protein